MLKFEWKKFLNKNKKKWEIKENSKDRISEIWFLISFSFFSFKDDFLGSLLRFLLIWNKIDAYPLIWLYLPFIPSSAVVSLHLITQRESFMFKAHRERRNERKKGEDRKNDENNIFQNIILRDFPQLFFPAWKWESFSFSSL